MRSLQFGQNRCHALGEVRVSDIETDSNIGEVSGLEDLEDVCRTCDIVLQVFDQQLYSERAGKGAQMLERSHRELKGSRAPGVFALAEVDNEEPKGNLLGDFEGALDLVHAIDASGLLRMDDVDAGRTAAAHFVIGIERRVHGEGLGLVRPEPLGEVADGAAVGVVEVLARGEKFDSLGT